MPSRDSRVTFQVADPRPQYCLPEPHNQSYQARPKPTVDAYFYNWPPAIRSKSSASSLSLPRAPIYKSKSVASCLDRTSRGNDNEPESVRRKLKGKAPAFHEPVEPTFRWIKGELIGKGSHGRVYLAFNATSGEIMAVKQVERPLTKSDRMKSDLVKIVETLREEREHMKDLDHPNIVQYLGFEENEATVNIFLEYVSGGSIGGCLKTHGRFKDEVTRYFTAQILEGLSYLHNNGIVHRDLKGDNILVEESGVCKISDFGISKKLGDRDRAFSFKGTSYWMAPETLRIGGSGQGYDMKIDIWSMGCIAFEMWTAKRPWLDENILSVLMKLSEAKHPPPLPDGFSLSPLASHFRRECFKLNADDRPSASVLLEHPYLNLPPNWSFPGMSEMGYKSLKTTPRKQRARDESPDSVHGTGASDITKIHSQLMDVDVFSSRERPASPALTMNSSVSRSGVRPLPPTPIPSIWGPPRPTTPPLVTITPTGPRKPKFLGRSNSVGGVRSSNSSLLSEAGDTPVIKHEPCTRQPRHLILHRGSEQSLDIPVGKSQKTETISEDGDSNPSKPTTYTYIPPALPEKKLATPYSTHLLPQVKSIELMARYPAEHLQYKSSNSNAQASLHVPQVIYATPFSRREPKPLGDPSSQGQSISTFGDTESTSGSSSMWQKPPPDVGRYRSKLSGDESENVSTSAQDYPSSSLSSHRVSAFAGPTRPCIREVYENLQEFFPAHNLDEPVIESPIEPNHVPNRDSARAKRVTMRSINTIAEEQINRGQLNSPQCRGQTRLWDSRLEEIKIP